MECDGNTQFKKLDVMEDMYIQKAISFSDHTVDKYVNASFKEQQSLFTVKCNLCEFVALNSKVLKTHMHIHDKSREIKCYLCDERLD